MLDHVVGCCNGFTIRLMTCGGIAEALRMIRRGRELGFQIALDSTMESSRWHDGRRAPGRRTSITSTWAATG